MKSENLKCKSLKKTDKAMAAMLSANVTPQRVSLSQFLEHVLDMLISYNGKMHGAANERHLKQLDKLEDIYNLQSMDNVKSIDKKGSLKEKEQMISFPKAEASPYSTDPKAFNPDEDCIVLNTDSEIDIQECSHPSDPNIKNDKLRQLYNQYKADKNSVGQELSIEDKIEFHITSMKSKKEQMFKELKEMNRDMNEKKTALARIFGISKAIDSRNTILHGKISEIIETLNTGKLRVTTTHDSSNMYNKSGLTGFELLRDGTALKEKQYQSQLSQYQVNYPTLLNQIVTRTNNYGAKMIRKMDEMQSKIQNDDSMYKRKINTEYKRKLKEVNMKKNQRHLEKFQPDMKNFESEYYPFMNEGGEVEKHHGVGVGVEPTEIAKVVDVDLNISNYFSLKNKMIGNWVQSDNRLENEADDEYNSDIENESHDSLYQSGNQSPSKDLSNSDILIQDTEQSDLGKIIEESDVYIAETEQEDNATGHQTVPNPKTSKHANLKTSLVKDADKHKIRWEGTYSIGDSTKSSELVFENMHMDDQGNIEGGGKDSEGGYTITGILYEQEWCIYKTYPNKTLNYIGTQGQNGIVSGSWEVEGSEDEGRFSITMNVPIWKGTMTQEGHDAPEDVELHIIFSELGVFGIGTDVFGDFICTGTFHQGTTNFVKNYVMAPDVYYEGAKYEKEGMFYVEGEWTYEGVKGVFSISRPVDTIW